MIDLHTHTLFSDGELIPSELARRAQVKGYRAIAFTDHMDESSMDFAIPRIVRIAEKLSAVLPLTVLPGAEITHVPPSQIPLAVKEARKLGAKIIVVHGETVVEPVEPGTNRAAIEAGADILAHPGLISEDDLLFAKEKGTYLEITIRKGHSLSNGYVARMAMRHTVPLVVNTDTHSPADLVTREFAEMVLLAAGIDRELIPSVLFNSEKLVKRSR
ncbi:MAG: histidinol phosphate phosphatase domain-containing protein [bacterium]